MWLSREVELVRQPKRSRTCGQCVVSMILSIPLCESIRLIGKRGGTKSQDLRRALGMRGISAGDVVLTRHASVPDKAILRLSRKTGKNWHWMLIWNGRIYDPAESWEQRVSEGWQVTSFMPLEGC